MHSSQCLFNIVFVSCTKILVLPIVVVPHTLFISLALKNTTLSGKIAQMNAVHNNIPDAHQNRLLQHELVTSLWKKSQVDNCSNEIANCIALLNYTTGKTMKLNRQILECSSRSLALYTTHCYTKQGPKGKELLKWFHKT
jgi:hypothetical protein